MKITLLLFLLMLGACHVPPEPFTQKRLILTKDETVKLSQINITLTNKGCGRVWEDESEHPFCDLEISNGDSTVHLLDGSKPAYLGVVKIEIDRMNPWGREEDSIPPGGCRVVVTKLPDNAR